MKVGERTSRGFEDTLKRLLKKGHVRRKKEKGHTIIRRHQPRTRLLNHLPCNCFTLGTRASAKGYVGAVTLGGSDLGRRRDGRHNDVRRDAVLAGSEGKGLGVVTF